MTDELVNIEISVRTNKIGSECKTTIDFEREDWDHMSEDQKENLLLEALWDSGLIDWNWEEVEG